MVLEKIKLTKKEADGYIIPLGPINLVFAVTDKGMVGCGAFDVTALSSFSYPVVRVKSKSVQPVATIDDLLEGTVKDTNAEAAELGITIGMSGREALDLM